MPFLQAIFCVKGLDDRNRFFTTSVITILGFIFCSVIFSNNLLVSAIILLLSTVILTLSTKRRLHDAKLNKNLQLVPSGLFLLMGLLSLFIQSSAGYYLLILPALSIAFLLTYPTKNIKDKNKYILGYLGPVDLSHFKKETTVTKTPNQRIEPILKAGSSHEQLNINKTVDITAEGMTQNDSFDSTSNDSKADIGELIRLKFLSNRALQLGVIMTVSLFFIGILITSAMNENNSLPNDINASEVNELSVSTSVLPANILTNKQHRLTMPDNFNLYMSEYRGIIINWQADQVGNGELWSQLTLKGDKSCQEITFNKGRAIRPLAVFVEDNSEYFASFSPLDTAELIRDLAFRGKFSLCGYNFSLKGSQGALGKHNEYGSYLE